MPPKRKAQSSGQPDAKRLRPEDSVDSQSTTDFGELTADKVSQMSYADLRTALKGIGENPGPINDSTRPMYEKLLVRRGKQIKEQASAGTESAGRATWQAGPASTTFTSPSTPGRYSSAGEGSFLSPNLDEPPFVPASKTPQKKGGIGKSSTSTTGWLASKRGGKPSTAGRANNSPTSLRGIIPATFTPLTRSGDLNLPIIDVYADYLVQNDVSAVFVNGTTSEGVKLSVEERKQVVEQWMESLNGRLPVIVHVGSESLKDAQELAIHAYSVGACAIACMAPCTFKPRGAEHMVQYLLGISTVVPTLPLYYYHIPPLTGSTFSIEDFLDQAVKQIPSFAGLKYSDADLSTFLACRAHSNGSLHLMYGKDEQMLGALAMGAETFVGSTYSLFPLVYHNIMEAFSNGKLAEAQKEQLRSQQVVKCLLNYGGVIPAGRALLSLRGIAVGPPRLPDREVSMQEMAAMERELKAMGFFNWS